ncbi:M48 family metallopeptidase [Asanoa sp. NPDC050611]|uniref:M48 family metallopeptidase n=1 Tax=Asanoa sp. NPDC050611 TaxID=3157098 RepID=UPI0033E100AD
MTDTCPTCAVPLAVEEDEPPWCPRCEWNLDALAPIEHSTWFYRQIRTRDHRAGFRADKLLATGTPVRPGGGHGLLVAVSAVLLAVPAAAVVAAIWLLVAGPVVIGLLLLLVAYLVRPRLGRVRTILKGLYRLDADRAPALHALIDRVAAATGAPRPDIVAVEPGLWGAWTTVAGIRQRRILTLGIPLVASVERGELVALLGHELGHFANRDSRRRMLTMPARVTFGHIASGLRPSRVSGMERDLLGLYLIVYEVWRLVSGMLSWLAFAVHATIHVSAARDDRRAEQEADRLAVRAAGRAATLGLLDATAAFPLFHGAISGVARKGYAMAEWRERVALSRARNESRTGTLRQLTIRTEASLFSSHPSTGRRHQFVSALPDTAPAVTVNDAEWATVVRELAPYAETLRKELAEQYEM